MIRSRNLVSTPLALTVLAAVLAACGGGAATQAPGGGTPGPGAATADPGNGNGNGNGSGGGGTGKVTYEVTGDVRKVGDLPFFAFGSRFDRAGAAGLNLTFTNEGGGIFTISEVNGAHSIGLVDESHGLSWAACETYEVNISGNSATGRLECSQGFGTNVADGSMISNVKLVATFDARA